MVGVCNVAPILKFSTGLKITPSLALNPEPWFRFFLKRKTVIGIFRYVITRL